MRRGDPRSVTKRTPALATGSQPEAGRCGDGRVARLIPQGAVRTSGEIGAATNALAVLLPSTVWDTQGARYEALPNAAHDGQKGHQVRKALEELRRDAGDGKSLQMKL
jgi:hypothetical protein